MAGPLEGIRVFDLTLMMVGPWSTQNLGQMGAEVFHVERGGVEGRSLGGGTPPSINGTSVVFMTCNMNKRQIFLDLKSEFDQRDSSQADRDLRRLRQQHAPGVVDRLGLSYESCARINPRLIYLAVSGWGEEGPMADKMATDNRVQSLAAFASMNGAPGTNGEMYRHYTQIDGSSGNYITQAVLLGLLARERTGRGQRINLTMTEACLALQTSRIGEFLATGKRPRQPRLRKQRDRAVRGVSLRRGRLPRHRGAQRVAVAGDVPRPGTRASARRRALSDQRGAARESRRRCATKSRRC